MPELPEVEIVVQTLGPELKNKKIIDVKINYSKVIKIPEINEFLKILKNKTIIGVNRMAKHILFDLGDYILISHLRMEGKYYIVSEIGDINKNHVLIEFVLDDGKSLLYYDTRRFGTFHLLKKDEYLKVNPLQKLGVEAWHIKKDDLYEKIHNRKRHIKTLLLDQTIISGLGNIYVDEVLFECKIHPEKLGNEITKKECEDIIQSSNRIFTQSIKLGGTTIASYTSSLGVGGKFQNELKIHTRAKKPCYTCGTTIVKIKVGGRGTYYCPQCQPRKI